MEARDFGGVAVCMAGDGDNSSAAVEREGVGEYR